MEYLKSQLRDQVDEIIGNYRRHKKAQVCVYIYISTCYKYLYDKLNINICVTNNYTYMYDHYM